MTLLCGILLARGAVAAAPSGPAEPAALTPSLGIVANRTDAERGDGVGWTAWLNLTGTGQLEQTWLNVSFEEDLTPDASNALGPRRCMRLVSFSWICGGLRAGSYTWTFEATISTQAPLGDWVNATVEATMYTGGSFTRPPGASAGPRVRGSDIVLQLLTSPTSAAPGGTVNVTVLVRNDPVGNASDSVWNVTIAVDADSFLLVDPGTNLSLFAAELTVGSSLSLIFSGVVAPNASAGSQIAVRALLTHEKYNYEPADPVSRVGVIDVLPPDGPTETVLGAIAAFFGVVLAGVFVLLVVGQRRIRIDEIFLMHRSGILIQHHSRAPALKKDDDLVASMLVAVQEFVRDSFRSEATLDEFSFGGRRAAIVRGKYVVLAAIISRGGVRYLVPQVQGAVRDIEAAHGSELANWDGRISRIDRAEPIIGTLLAGGYRGTRAWMAWAVRAMQRLGRLR